MNKQLTKAEEQIIQVIWELEEASVNEIIDKLPSPKPAKTTVSTIVRILESKEFLGHKQKGRGYVYFPLVQKMEYSNQTIHKLVDGYFKGSFKSMVSFFVKENNMDLNEFEQILNDIKDDE